ncbi:MAG: hypothetical protein JNK02_09180 [Planctomycetes bacterium]|nr:hypothetical protein [Planctomycetota bacterium]
MSSAPRREGWIAGGVLAAILLLALFLQTGERAGASTPGSVGATQPDGRRALALVLARVGARPEAWRQVPAALPSGRHALWRADPAPRAPDAAPLRKPPPGVGMHAPEHYATFLHGGGTLLVEGRSGLNFLRDVLELAAAASLELRELPDAGPRPVRLVSGERATVDVRTAFESLDPALSVRAIAVAEDPGGEDQAFALEIPVGAGRAIAIADGRPFDNAAIGLHDHALLAVRLAESVPPGARVLHDEYALGLWEERGFVAAATRPAAILASLHALLLILVLAWRQGFPRAFPRDPEPLESFSPLLRARAQARFLERAGRLALLAPALQLAALDRLARALRLAARPRARASANASPSAAEVERVARLLPDDLAREARRLLGPAETGSRAALEALAVGLDRLEAQVARRGDPRLDRGR